MHMTSTANGETERFSVKLQLIGDCVNSDCLRRNLMQQGIALQHEFPHVVDDALRRQHEARGAVPTCSRRGRADG